MQTPWPLRSLLFVPAHRIDWVRKIGRTPADAVMGVRMRANIKLGQAVS